MRPPKILHYKEFAARAAESRKFHKNFVSPPVTPENFDELLRRNENETNKLFLIFRAADDAIAGAINLSQIFRRGFQNAYLGYYLFEEFAGNGYMTEAVKLILDYSFKILKLHRIEANVQPENKASIKVLKRCGFTQEGFSRKYLKIGGRWRDHERWAIIVEDWKKKKNGKQGSKITNWDNGTRSR